MDREESWTASALKILENAIRADPAGNSPRLEGRDYDGIDRPGLTPGSRYIQRVRPSGCVLRRDAHHTIIPLATATILTARLASKKSQPRAGRESKEREPDPRWGPTRSLGQVYYLCFIRSGAQRMRPAAPGSLVPSLGKRWRSLNSEKTSAIFSQKFLRLDETPRYRRSFHNLLQKCYYPAIETRSTTIIYSKFFRCHDACK